VLPRVCGCVQTITGGSASPEDETGAEVRYVDRPYDICGVTTGIGDTVSLGYRDHRLVTGVVLRELVLATAEITAEDRRYPFKYEGWQENTFRFWEIMTEGSRVRRFGGDIQVLDKAKKQRRLF